MRNDEKRRLQRPHQPLDGEPRAVAARPFRARRANDDEAAIKLGGECGEAIGGLPLPDLAGIAKPALFGFGGDRGRMREDFALDLVLNVTPETDVHGGVVEPIVAEHSLPEIRHDDQVMQSPARGAEIKRGLLGGARAGRAVAGEKDRVRAFHEGGADRYPRKT
mgnify:CR=1 FL=1